MPADGHQPTRATFSAKSPLQCAKDTARDCEVACCRAHVPQRPPGVAFMSASQIAALRTTDPASSVLAEWNAWQVAYSTAVAINRSRLRGALWAHRELGNHADDEAAQLFREKLGTFLGKEWGAHVIPTDMRECDQLAEMTASTIAKARRPTWEDFNRMANG